MKLLASFFKEKEVPFTPKLELGYRYFSAVTFSIHHKSMIIMYYNIIFVEIHIKSRRFVEKRFICRSVF